MLVVISILALLLGVGSAWLRYRDLLQRSRDELSRAFGTELVPWPRSTLGSRLYYGSAIGAASTFLMGVALASVDDRLSPEAVVFFGISLVCAIFCAIRMKHY